MENKNGNKGLYVLLVILCLLVLLLLGYIIYDKTSSNSVDDEQQINNENVVQDNNQASTDGKIYIKRNGKIDLEAVPNDIVGKYVNKDEKNDYFILKDDGTAIISFPSGDSGKVIMLEKVSYQLTYYQGSFDNVVLEFYRTDGVPYSPIRLGKKYEDNYSFTVTEETPSASVGHSSYMKQEN